MGINILFTYYPLFIKYNEGVALLTAICKEKGIQADYLPCGIEFLNEMIKYDIIGFSFVTKEEYEASLPYMRLVLSAGKKILAGGVYARGGEIVDQNIVHYVCRGEGEILPDFLLDGDEAIFKQPYYHKDLDTLPRVDLSHITGTEFCQRHVCLQGHKIIPYQTSRGCPYHCSFCQHEFQPKGVRVKHTIREDLLYLTKTYDQDLIYILDELPPYYSKIWREQWEGLTLPFFCYIHAGIRPEHLEFLIEHSLKFTAFGVESGNEKFRNEVLKKSLTDKQLWTTIDILRKNNIIYSPFFMGNIPGESREDRVATIKMMAEVGGMPVLWEYDDLRKRKRLKEWE